MKNYERQAVRRARQGGFTLIEMLLVVVIIGMLATIVTVSIPKHMRKARESKAAADIQSIGIAIQSYYMEEGKYPGSLDLLTSGDDPYLDKGIPKDPWGNAYTYSYPGAHKPFKFDLASMGEDGVPSDDDVANWKQDASKP
ncbi:MAG TPA: type II secretion system protein GspG [Kiritimatiellia bacterium]|nr:type II secretion system protein GspG [Kiritimatiellia bacterium]HSA18875.1 type II secretion system protein GspG [Kiritimatiellia bacterium]